MGTALLTITIAMFLGALGTAVAAGFARGAQARTIRRVSTTLATKFITMKHLRSGNATRAEWTQVIATMVALISFAMMFFSIAWMVGGTNPLFALAIAIIPGLWLAGALRVVWTDWRAAGGRGGF